VNDRVAAMTPRTRARAAGALYLVTLLSAGSALLAGGDFGFVAGFVAGLCFIAVTLLFYGIFKPVSRSLSLVAALISLLGCTVVPATMLFKWSIPAASISVVFFGIYCVLIAVLIFRSAFLPRILGALMILAGLGWLTFLYSPLAQSLYPYVFAPGVLGQGSLAVWLLLVGVDPQKWTEQATGVRSPQTASPA
jgi:hypothetical protein